MSITVKQYEQLMKPLNATRVAKRSQGGKSLSYLEAWDVKAHLIRVFGFGNFDVELLDYSLIGVRTYEAGEKKTPMAEPIWNARVQLTVRDPEGNRLCRYTEAAIGSASAPASMVSEAHDNAIKTAESDALKRCAINLGTQFGLSLYDNGATRDVVRGTMVVPEGYEAPKPAANVAEAEAALAKSLGATEVGPAGTNGDPSLDEVGAR